MVISISGLCFNCCGFSLTLCRWHGGKQICPMCAFSWLILLLSIKYTVKGWTITQHHLTMHSQAISILNDYGWYYRLCLPLDCAFRQLFSTEWSVKYYCCFVIIWEVRLLLPLVGKKRQENLQNSLGLHTITHFSLHFFLCFTQKFWMVRKHKCLY